MPEMIEIETLTAMIQAGWGDVPRTLIPPDWDRMAAPTRRSVAKAKRTKAPVMSVVKVNNGNILFACLVDLCQKNGGEIHISQPELAEILQCSRHSVVRMTAELLRKQLIEVYDHKHAPYSWRIVKTRISPL